MLRWLFETTCQEFSGRGSGFDIRCGWHQVHCYWLIEKGDEIIRFGLRKMKWDSPRLTLSRTVM